MANALKIISTLLSYPSKELQAARLELKAAVLEDGLTGAPEKALLNELIDDITTRDVYEAQERYVELFDRTRTLSLHLFEHVHGESRDRGQAMVDLKQMYEDQGFELAVTDLPDFLPMFIEFASIQIENEREELLGQTVHILSALRQRLKKKKSIYANAFQALEAIISTQADPKVVEEILSVPDDDPNDLEALDAVWEEEVVTFGGGQGEDTCGPDRLGRQIRAAKRPAPRPTVQ
ncbi:nitrate reductase molybdenum cofactor assembly chaperone [Maritalea sp.]|uniref:nitrate reductase molybdenum cofactor assembly chaperone n=1 Tax=Maritalea sp. TaxID=2003361 RepID=UPI003EF3A0B4